MGWTVPNEDDLLREAMYYAGYSEPHQYYRLLLEAPDEQPRFNTPDRTARTLATSYTVDEDYQATVDLVGNMFSRLPANWKVRYRQELEDASPGRTEYTALGPVIMRIRRELGLSPNSYS